MEEKSVGFCMDLVNSIFVLQDPYGKMWTFGGIYKILAYPLSIRSFISVTESRPRVKEKIVNIWTLLIFMVALICLCWKIVNIWTLIDGSVDYEETSGIVYGLYAFWICVKCMKWFEA